MTPATSTLASSPSLPTLAGIQRRRRELLAYQSGQRTAPATAPPDDPFDEEESSLEEDACLDQEAEDPDYAEDSDDDEDPEPSPATGPPTLADPALYGLAGLAVRTPAPHTEADPAILLQFLDGPQPCGPRSKTPKRPMRGLNEHTAHTAHTSPRATAET